MTSKRERDSILSLFGEAMTHRLSLFVPLAFLAYFALFKEKGLHSKRKSRHHGADRWRAGSGRRPQLMVLHSEILLAKNCKSTACKEGVIFNSTTSSREQEGREVGVPPSNQEKWRTGWKSSLTISVALKETCLTTTSKTIGVQSQSGEVADLSTWREECGAKLTSLRSNIVLWSRSWIPRRRKKE